MDIRATSEHIRQQIEQTARRLFLPFTIARAGIIATIVGGGLLFLVLVYWGWALVTGSVKLTNDQLAITLILTLVFTILSGIIALVATGLNLRDWRTLPEQRARMIAAGGSVLTVLIVLVFLLGAVRPRLQIALFAQDLQRTCGTPLSHIDNDIKGASDAARQNVLSDQDFAAAMNRYAKIFQQDAATIPPAMAQLKGLKAPDKQYQGMVTACAAEYQSLDTFLGGSNAITLPTVLPAPLGGMQVSVQSVLQMAASAALGTLTNVPQIPAFLLSPMISGIFDMAQNTCDASCQQLKSQGTSLQAAIFSPFKPQQVAP